MTVSNSGHISKHDARRLIRNYLYGNNELLNDTEYKEHPHPLAGHCYVASEAMYHVLGAKRSEYTPNYVHHEGTTHWFLVSDAGSIIDLTSGQFETTPPYSEGRGCGFQKTPSDRCIEVLSHLEQNGIKIMSPDY